MVGSHTGAHLYRDLANSGYLHGDSDGMPPVATHQLIMTLMLPRMLYRLDSVILLQTDVQNQDTHHSKILHNLPFLTEEVTRKAIQLLFGLLPVEAEIHVRVLTPQGNHIPICHKPRYYLDKYEGREMLHAGLSKLKKPCAYSHSKLLSRKLWITASCMCWGFYYGHSKLLLQRVAPTRRRKQPTFMLTRRPLLPMPAFDALNLEIYPIRVSRSSA